MELKPKEKAKQLFEKVDKHTKYWDCYNDEPLTYNHTKKVVLTWVKEILDIDLNSKDKRYWNEVLYFVKNNYLLND
jgi:hypothetical protein